MFGFIAEALEFAVDQLFEKLYEVVWSNWEHFVPSFNPGQVSIFFQNMESEVYGWLDDAQSVWPDADADYYVDGLYSCYDGEVMERAFSESIGQPVDRMWEIIETAQMLRDLAAMFEALDFI